MMRWDIINHLIKKTQGTDYLEIGYYKGWSFDAVKAKRKTAVDPFPCKTEEQEAREYASLTDVGKCSGEEKMYKLTSDDFFNSLNPDQLWDVIFIDGLHEEEQVKNDIENSIKHLKPGGYIVLHDMNPPLEAHTTTGIDGCWTGDCYRAVLTDVRPYWFETVDTDWGVGILQPFQPAKVDENMSAQYEVVDFSPLDYERAKTDWEYFDQNRKELMNIISEAEFFQKY